MKTGRALVIGDQLEGQIVDYVATTESPGWCVVSLKSGFMISQQLQNIIKGECKQSEVVVHISTMT